MTTQKKGPSAVGAAAEAEIVSCPIPEENTNMDKTTSAPEYSATDVAEALAMIDAGDVPCVDIDEDDDLYQDVPAVVLKPLSWLGASVEESGWIHRVVPIDATGRKAPSDEWPDFSGADVSPQVRRYWQHTPNSAIRVGDQLAVSHGMVLPVAEKVIDGERMVELVTHEELQRRQRAEKDGWLAAHPEIASMSLGWGAKVSVDTLNGVDGVDLWWEREFGRAVRMSRHASYRAGVLTYDDDSTTPDVIVDRDFVEDLSLDDMRELASALMAAIPVMEAAIEREVR